VTFTVFVGLQPPTNLAATPGDSRVTLSWTANAGATGYNVKRATTSGGPYTTVGPNLSGTTYLDTPLVNGQTYYYVVSSVNGGTESANSTQVSATPNGIDLVVTAMGNPPATAAPGGTFSASDTVRNQGAVAAGASTTRFYLSLDQQRDGSDLLLGGSRSVSALGVGQSSSGNITVTIPPDTPLGTYYLVSCADDLNAVSETNETNNCRASTTTIQVGLADLLVTSLSNPPATAAAGGTFSVTATIANQGAITAGASTARYYLSADQVKGVGDVLLTGTRSVASLTAGQSSNGSTTVTIPSNTPAGSYYLLGCADDTLVVSESNESNNCRASTTTIQISLPDLVVTSVSNPPATAGAGGTFSVTATIANQGTATAAASTARFYLSTDQLKDGGDALLSGTRSVASLTAGQSSSGSTTVTIPSSMAAGTYYLLACADDTLAVSESNEGNNCRASANTVQIALPDLVVSALVNPPSTIQRGRSFKVTDTVTNQGTVTAGASTTQYYLSTDQQKGGPDILLSGSRSVSSLAAGQSSTAGNKNNITVPSNTPVGTYYLLACADDTSAVSEVDETNNCRASTTKVVVQ